MCLSNFSVDISHESHESVENKLTDEELNKAKDAENILLIERKKRIKPFFDDKVQTDLNCYWLYSNLYSSLILNDQELYKKRLAQLIILMKNSKITFFIAIIKKTRKLMYF